MFSIIVPVYNAQKYIKKCIISVLKSSYSDFELILIDDGSSDKSYEICEKYLNDNRVYLYKKINGGVSSARNYGLKYAKGDYVIFLDSDDYLPENALYDYYNILNKTNTDFICGSFEFYSLFNHKKELLSDNFLECSNINSDYLNVFLSLNRILSKVYKRSILDLHNIRFNESFSFAEDTLFSLDYFKYCKNIYITSKVLYIYRRPIFKKTLSKSVTDNNKVYLSILEKYIMIMCRSDDFNENLKLNFENQWFFLNVRNYMIKTNNVHFQKETIEELIKLYHDYDDKFYVISVPIFSFSNDESYALNNNDISKFISIWKKSHTFLKRFCKKIKKLYVKM